MRVLIDANTINTGKSGIGYYTYNLIRELSRLTDNSFDLTMAIRGNVWRMLEKNGFDNVHNLVVEEKHFRKYLPFPSQSLQGYDIFHEPNYVPRKFNGATVVTIADLSYRFFPQYHPWRRVKMLRLFEGRMRNASRIITISENSRREIEEVLRIPPERIKVTYLGADESFRPFKVDKDKKDEMIAKYGLPEHFVLFVGNIEPRKNLERLVQAYYLCRQEGNFPDEIKLVLAGGKGWLNEGVFSLVSSLGLDLDVIFTGYVRDEDLAVLYNMALAFVYPSLYEGFGLPPLEAMSCGIPVISSNTSSIPEVVGDAGILVDPYRVEDLAAAMTRVAESGSLRQEMSLQGLERARRFSWKRCAGETLQVYRECME